MSIQPQCTASWGYMGTIHFIWENYRFLIWDVKYYNTSSDFHLFSSTHVCSILFFFSWFIVHSNHCIYNYEFFLFEEFLYNLKRTNMRECDSDALICHFCSSNSKVPRAEVELQKRKVFEWTALHLSESFRFCELLDVVPSPFPCRIQG